MTYGTAHDNVRRIHGPAVDHSCVSCGGPAVEWAYQHGAPDEQRNDEGRLPFSMDPAFYAPMCRRCHNSFDAKVDATHQLRLSQGAAQARANDYLRGNEFAEARNRVLRQNSLEISQRMKGDPEFFEARRAHLTTIAAATVGCEECDWSGRACVLPKHHQTAGHGAGFNPDRCCTNGRCSKCRQKVR